VQALAEVLLARCKAEEKQGGGRGSQIAELRVLMEMWAVRCVLCGGGGGWCGGGGGGGGGWGGGGAPPPRRACVCVCVCACVLFLLCC
jgi:hypothetical protein